MLSLAWDESVDTTKSLEIMKDLALSHARRGGVEGTLIASFIENEDWVSLVSYELDYSENWDVFQLLECRQALGFFQKFEHLNLGIDREHVAYDKFIASELACAEINQLFRLWDEDKVCLMPPLILRLEKARHLVHRVLGRCPSVSELNLRFGPGATTSTRRTDACPMNKFSKGLQCSRSLFLSGLLPTVLRELPHWVDALTQGAYGIDDEGWLYELVTVDLHPGRLNFVPKNAKSYRSILVEPVLNSMLQSGIGQWMTRRLGVAGIDIRDQSRNAEMARRGSLTGSLATLDLSSASDTISVELVKFLLPDDWFMLLKAARTETAEYKGRITNLQKFSSMGNGFTFPLETLIFWSLTRAVCEGTPDQDIGVYGDDIVCPVLWADDVIKTLEGCGFTINLEKSFTGGPFRESCGHDYYMGIDIRPYYQKELISGATLFTLHNFYFRHGQFDLAQEVVGHIPRPLRLFGPDGYGDGHLLSDRYDDTCTAKMRRKGYSGHRFDTFSRVPRRCMSRYPGDYVSPLYSVYVKDRSDAHPLIRGISDSIPLGFSESGAPLWGLPGDNGYKRISIYTLG